jgi:phenylpropionate dioxygenase-like ring-hydroxylating dioxygenase large terminal subunit
MSNFLHNAWYAGAWSNEVDTGFLARRILDKPILFYRDDAGEAIAIGGICPHRFAPFELGRRLDSTIECGYHGLRFDRTGNCILNPNGSRAIPATARVPSYPLVERYGLLWIWMGDHALANDAAVPDYFFLSDSEHYTSTEGAHLHVEANYRLLCDNLMDVTHAGYLHAGTLGNDGTPKGRLEVDFSGTTVNSNFWIPDHPAPPGTRMWINCGDAPVDHWIDMQWNPGCCIKLDVGITLAGQPRSEGRGTRATHLLTPETELTTHYFYASSRTYSLGDAAATAANRERQRYAFEEEDAPMIEAVQRSMATTDLFALKPAVISTDAGGIRVRRILDELIAKESSVVASR